MEPRHELLVFNKKEVGIILMLLGLVALFSFTLGVRLGKKLSLVHSTESHGHAPLTGEAAHSETAHHEAAGHGHDTTEHKSAAEDKVADKVAAKEAQTAAAVAEEHADEALSKEIDEKKAGTGKALPMSFPTERKTEKAPQKKSEKVMAGKFTLQVGSHRTLAEAVEQVNEFKKNGLDAFYREVQIPGKGTWYRVGIGLFPSKEMAEKTAANWKTTKKLPSYIIQKVSE